MTRNEESKVAMKIFDEQLFHHQFIYPPSLSFQFYLNLAVRNAKGILFLSIQGELFNSAVGKRDIMHRRTIKKFLYTVIISNEIVFH